MQRTTVNQAAELRAAVARHKIPLFQLGAAIGVHPSRLGEMLNERRSLPAGLAEEIAHEIERLAAASSSGRGGVTQ